MLEARGKRVPKELIPPTIIPGYESWFEDFWELSSNRMVGQVFGPLPKWTIDSHTLGWPPGEARVFRKVMRSMDQIYLKWVNGQGEKEAPESDNSARDAFRSAMRGRR